MKAVVYTRYGPPDVLQTRQIDQPIPDDDQLLVKVYATTVNRTDNATIKAIPFFARLITGVFKPAKSIPGTEFAGEVIAAGKNVRDFKSGDRVLGFNSMGSCAYAQYLAIEPDYAQLIPDGIDYAQAAASSEGAHYAYSAIRKAGLGKGQSALVYGATGAIGSAAVQLLKYFGVTVTAVVSSKNIDLLKSLGADKVVDYQQEDFTRDAQQYDFVFDSVGKVSFFQCFKLLKRGGIYTSTDLGFLYQNIFLPSITSLIKPLLGYRKTQFPTPHKIRDSLLLIKSLLEQKQFTPVIDRHYPLNDIVDAFRYVEKGHKIGNVVIDVTHDDTHAKRLTA